MDLILPGAQLSLALTVTPIVRQTGGTVREALRRIAKLGFEEVQLDAALAGIRPRELDQRARKDLRAMLGRHSLRCGGLDLFIPRKDWRDAGQIDRAMSAALAAIQLAADLGRAPLSLPLPVADLADDTKQTLVEAADGHDVTLAIHAEDQLDALLAWVTAVDLPVLGAAIDPAPLLGRDEDPARTVARLGARLAVARVTDGQRPTGDEWQRCIVGEGDLDVGSYRLAVDLAQQRRAVVLDVRGLSDPVAAAAAGRRAWKDQQVL